jgi:protein gp37
MSRRLQAMGLEKYSAGFKTIRTHEEEVKRPFTWNKPRKVFVNSMSDLFHKEVPLGFIQRVFTTMNKCPKHQFQVLTKRAELLEQYSPSLIWTPNIWMGVSVEDQRVQFRIDHLRRCGAHIKFLSLEPLLGPLPDLDLTGIHWVIVGGESGRNPRPMKEEWVEDIRQQCARANVAFFFKQWGGINKKAAGRILNGEIYSEMPQLA